MPFTDHWVMRPPSPTTHDPCTIAANLAEVHRDQLARERNVRAQAESAWKRRILVPSS